MTQPSRSREELLAELDTTTPHSARVWNYWLGGKDNFAVDRQVGEQVLRMLPSIVEQARADRAFLGRAVSHLAGERGIRQFLDIGTGLPTADNTHEVAQRVAPEARIVYVDNDPMVMAHARALLTSTPEGDTRYLEEDLRNPAKILAEDAGIRQFLDIGTGIPSANNTHQVAQEVAPDARIVYVDNDPIVLSHARALLTSGPGGETQYVHGDAREPGPIIESAAETLDFSRPVALMLIGVLHLIQDSEDPWGLVAWLMAQLPAGSYLAISHPAIDIGPGQAEAQRRYNERVSTPQTLRDHDQVARFFEGLELVEPGLVYVHTWRPGEFDTAPEDATSAWGAVARKP